MRTPFSLMLAAALGLSFAWPGQAADSRIRLLEEVPGHPGAATWFQQRLLYTQRGLDQLMIWDQTRSNLLWNGPDCGPVAVAAAGKNLLVACQTSASLQLINPMGQELKSFAADANGQSLSGVQALLADRSGGVWIAQRGSSEHAGRILHLPSDGSAPRALAAQLSGPTSLALSPDGRLLYVGEQHSRQVRIFDVQTGKLVNGRVFKKIRDWLTPAATASEDPSPSALAVNAQGQLYVGLRGEAKILVVSAEGRLLSSIAFPESSVSSFSFGASERVLYALTLTIPESEAPGQLYEVRL